jgi:hypothetical protein
MSFNGSGVYSLPGIPLANGGTVDATEHNTFRNDVAGAFNLALTRDGQSSPTANIPMAGYKLMGLAAGSGVGDSVRFEQLPSASNLLPVDSGGTGAASFTSGALLKGNGTSAVSAASSSDIVSAINTTPVNNSTNLADGGAGQIPYQTGSGATSFVPAGTAGQVLLSNGTSAPSWGSAGANQIQPISASVASNALTISASALALDFRSTTLGSGTVTRVSGTPSNLVVPASATLGTVNNVASRLVVLALNNAGTIELAVVNLAGGTNLDETGLISTTAISSGSTSANVVYSTTARTSLAYRVIGFIDSTQTTAGTWATAPSTIQGVGGQALASLSSLGYGQTWQSVLGSRASGTTYYNTTGKPIMVNVTVNTGAVGGATVVAVVNGLTISSLYSRDASAPGAGAGAFFVVPVGASYSVTISGNAPTFNAWSELR